MGETDCGLSKTKRRGATLCYMRAANEAILRKRLPIPTIDIDEALEMKDRTVFKKLDFNMSFHQILLAAESRDVTTFCVQAGLFESTKG